MAFVEADNADAETLFFWKLSPRSSSADDRVSGRKEVWMGLHDRGLYNR